MVAPVVDAGAAAPEDAGVDLEPELAWIRARLPNMRTLHDGSPTEELLAWAEPGKTLELWLTSDKFRCAPTTGKLTEKGDQLDLTIVEWEKRVKGQRVRQMMDGYAGRLVTFGSGGSNEHQLPDGSWASDGAWGSSGGTIGGVLSEVSGDSARYDGSLVMLDVSCPWASRPCADGGQRICLDCENFEIRTTVIDSLHGAYGRIANARLPSKCQDPCPAEDSRSKDRADRLVEALDEPWILSKKKSGLYRTLAACKRDLLRK